MEVKRAYFSRKYNYALMFVGKDVEVMAAAARERIAKRAFDDEVEQIPIEDAEIAKWDKGVKRRSLKVNEFGTTVRQLEEFEADTKDIIKEIPEITCVPAFENQSIVQRAELGRHALLLAGQLRGEASVREFKLDFDTELSQLLAETPRHRE